MTLTKIALLNRMQCEQKYTATQLAHLFSVSRVTVLGMLRALVEEGQLQITRTNSRVIHFTRELPDSLESGGRRGHPRGGDVPRHAQPEWLLVQL
jgi:DNA-binding transcriptional regulator LsrR (DeoR family)